MKLNREQLLKELEGVTPGLSQREIIEQSSCFVFDGTQVMTFNDEIACFQKCSLNVQGAVQATRLLALLRKYPDELIDVSVESETLHLRGKGNRHSEFPMERDILLPVQTVKRPKEWRRLPTDFLEAVKLVRDCVGKDESQFHLTCVHVHPDYIESCDNFQAARFEVKTGVEKPFLVRKDSLKHITELGMTKFGMTKSWAHFKNPNGLRLSCRLYTDTAEYPDLAGILAVKGFKLTWPKGLSDCVDRAGELSATDADEDHVLVTLKKGKIKVQGRSVSGGHGESRKLDYKGKKFAFTISPKLMINILDKHNESVLSVERLKSRDGKFQYVTVLGTTKKAVTDDSQIDGQTEETE